MYKLTGIKLVFKGMSNRGDGPDNSVCVDIPLNDNQMEEVAERIGSFSQTTAEVGKCKCGGYIDLYGDEQPCHAVSRK